MNVGFELGCLARVVQVVKALIAGTMHMWEQTDLTAAESHSIHKESESVLRTGIQESQNDVCCIPYAKCQSRPHLSFYISDMDALRSYRRSKGGGTHSSSIRTVQKFVVSHVYCALLKGWPGRYKILTDLSSL